MNFRRYNVAFGMSTGVVVASRPVRRILSRAFAR